ncbi:MAG TPA: BMP family ABC transporter substrate-binding protein [Candidatus Limnocylindrales bacterium]|nr:BMP family ABC transporter substrate-binding protein [Candidatus Limnocylindrales bacterium]
MRSSVRLLSLGATAAILLAACTGGGGATTAPSVAPTTAASTEPSVAASASAPASEGAINTDWTACVAFDTGGLGDKNFNDLAKKGLDDAKALGYKTFFSEAQGATDYAANIQRLIDEGCQTIVTVGFLQSQATADAAKANPDIAFAQVDTAWNEAGPDFVMGTPDDTPRPPNFTGLDYQIDQASMLAGYLAAGWSKSGKVATYGGLAFPGVTRFMDGLYAGVQYYNKQKSKTVQVIGWDGSLKDPSTTGTFVGGSGGNDTWNDPAKGEQFAKTFLDQGVDIVHPVAGSTGNGTIKAMHAAGKWAIGVDADQWISLGDTEYHKALLTSAQKAIDVSVVDVFKKTSGGDIGGEDYSGTLANNGVLLAPFHDYDSQIPAELKAEIETLRAAIADGSITVCSFLGRGC